MKKETKVSTQFVVCFNTKEDEKKKLSKNEMAIIEYVRALIALFGNYFCYFEGKKIESGKFYLLLELHVKQFLLI